MYHPEVADAYNCISSSSWQAYVGGISVLTTHRIRPWQHNVWEESHQAHEPLLSSGPSLITLHSSTYIHETDAQGARDIAEGSLT
jgi:hypothetical protein